MTIPSSGPLSTDTIRGEFGGSHPNAMSEYYAGAGLVPPGTSGINGAVPSSGPLPFSKFRGTSAFIAHTDTFGNGQAGNIAVPAGATHLQIIAEGPGGPGGDWDGSNAGGCGGGGAAVVSDFAIISSDWGTNIAYSAPGQTNGGSNGPPTTAVGTINAGSFNISAGGGFQGGTNGSNGARGTATGGNTSNANGSPGSGGQGGTSALGNAGGFTACPGGDGDSPGGGGGGDSCGTGVGKGGYGRIRFIWT